MVIKKKTVAKRKVSSNPVRKASNRYPIKCMECGHKFTKAITARTYEIRCPKCHGYDTEPN